MELNQSTEVCDILEFYPPKFVLDLAMEHFKPSSNPFHQSSYADVTQKVSTRDVLLQPVSAVNVAISEQFSHSQRKGRALSSLLSSPAAAAFAVALRNNLTSHVEYPYFGDIYVWSNDSLLQAAEEDVFDDESVGKILWQSGSPRTQSVDNGWWCHLLAGGTAGAVSRTCTAPLDRLKCMLMVYGSSLNNARLSTVAHHMFQEGGIASFWRGNAINVAKVVPEMALKFMIYEQVKCVLKTGNADRELGIADRFLAGAIAGATAQSIIYPLEVMKTRLVIRKTGQYSGVVDCVAKLWRSEGIRGMYRGFIPNLLGIIPYAGIDLAVYETLKKCYKSRHNSEPGTFMLLTCGVVSSGCGQLASYPLSLVRTRLQANVMVDGGACTMSTTFRSILVTDGLTGLYRGMTANLLKVAPAVSLSYVVYEKTRSLLGAKMT